MRALHVIPSLSPFRGGPSYALPVLTQHLAALGLKVDVATTDDDGAGRVAGAAGTRTEAGGVTTRYFARQVRFYTCSWPLRTWLASNVGGFDLVHIHALFSYPATVAALESARHHVPYIVRPLGTLNHWGLHYRRPALKRLSLRLVERAILAHASAIHFTSDQEQAEAATLGLATPSFVIPLGLELPPPSLDQPPLEERPPAILFLGRLDPKKGLDLLLRAFARVHASVPDARLTIAGSGDGEYVADLRALAHRLGIAAAVEWPGFLEGAAKQKAFDTAMLFVLPSHSENFGVAPVEAMAAGLPVILTPTVGVAPDVERCEAGIIVPPEPTDLGAAIERLLRNPAEARAMGGRARRLAEERFSAPAAARHVLDLYDFVLKQRKTTA